VITVTDLTENFSAYSVLVPLQYDGQSESSREIDPTKLPLLEALTEDFLWNLPGLDRRIRLYVLYGCETCLLDSHFQRREQPKVTPSNIRIVRCLGDDRNVFLGEELLNNKGCMARCVIVMQKPLSLPLVRPLPPDCISQSLQNLRYGLTVLETVDVFRKLFFFAVPRIMGTLMQSSQVFAALV
jgi:hypothetical protein